MFIPGILKKDLKEIDGLFFKRLTEQLINDMIINDQNEIETIWKPSKLCFYKTNNNRSATGRINYFVDAFKHHYWYEYESLELMDTFYENGLLNDIPIELKREGVKFWTNPIDEMSKLKKHQT